MKETKLTWFRKLEATTTLTVPNTLNSGLAKRLREVLVQYPGLNLKGTSTMVIEHPGHPLMLGITKGNPFSTPEYIRVNCPLTKCNDKYSKVNDVYRAICQSWKVKQILECTDPKKVIQWTYVGETSKTIKVRVGKHYDDFIKCLNSKDKNNKWQGPALVARSGTFEN